MSTRVGVVVVNYHGGDLTIECLHSLLATDWPTEDLDIVLVDNASDDRVPERVEAELPAVQVIRSATNLGFAGGCNLGIRALPDAHAVALVNNDATVDPGWLAPLVATLDADSRIGAACPKILFASPMVDIEIHAPTHRRGRGDRRDLGVRCSGARTGDTDVWTRTQLVEGFWGSEPGPPGEPRGQWTHGEARLRVPGGTHDAELRLSSEEPKTVELTSGTATATFAAGPDPQWCPIPLGAPAVDIVNNVGTVIDAEGFGSDRGFLEPDDGRFDAPEDVEAWCAAAVLLARAYLDDVGLLDERLFLYYEDLELSVRGAAQGWRYRYVPTSVIRHVHSATSVEDSPLATYYNERNRLLVVARHRSIGDVLRAAGRYAATTASYARRDVLSPIAHGHRPRGDVVARRTRAFGGFLRRAAAMRRSRRRRPTVG